jgi:hypothetical protein
MYYNRFCGTQPLLNEVAYAALGAQTRSFLTPEHLYVWLDARGLLALLGLLLILLVKLKRVLEGLELKVSGMLGPQELVAQDLNSLASIITGPKKGAIPPISNHSIERKAGNREQEYSYR